MSLDAMLAVLRFSPYKLATRLVHLAIADTVSEGHDWLYWEGDGVAAAKALVDEKSVRRAKLKMVEDGALIDLGRHQPTGNKLYRFVVPTGRPDNLSDERPDKNDERPDKSSPSDRTNRDPLSYSTEIRTQEHLSVEPTASDRSNSPIVLALCAHLQTRIAAYREDPNRAPKITAQWRKDFRLLIEVGPEKREKPESVDPERVRGAIDFVFSALATPEGPNHFCWAGIVQSPGALRKHWDKIYDAGMRIRRAARNDPFAEFRTPDANLAMALGADPLAEFRTPAIAR